MVKLQKLNKLDTLKVPDEDPFKYSSKCPSKSSCVMDLDLSLTTNNRWMLCLLFVVVSDSDKNCSF